MILHETVCPFCGAPMHEGVCPSCAWSDNELEPLSETDEALLHLSALTERG